MRAADLTPRRSWPGGITITLVVVALGVVARLAGAAVQGNEVEAWPGIADQLSYHALAQRVLDGHGFSFAEGHWPATPAGEPTAHWSFLYTSYLALVYATVGTLPVVARLLQALVVGLLQPWLAYRLGHRLFGTRAGLAAAMLTAGYAYFVYYAGGLLTEGFYLVAVLWTLDVVLRLAAAPGPRPWRTWIELGLAIGVAGLLRQVFLVCVPVLALGLWWARQAAEHEDGRPGGWRHTGAGLLVAGMVSLLCIVPWTARNYAAYGRLVPLNTNAGFAFFWGNHPIHGTRFMPLLEGAERSYGELIPEELRGLDEAAMDRALLSRALAGIADDPGRYLQLSASRVPEYFKFWPSAASGLTSNLARVLSFGVTLPLMALGVGLSLRGRRRVALDAPTRGVVILLLWAGTYTLVHLLTWTLVRYRLPVDAVLLVFAGLAVARLADRVWPADRRVVARWSPEVPA